MLEDDTIQGLGGNDLFRYYLTGWDDVIVDTGGDDTIQFDSAIDFKAFALIRDGDDLYIDLQDSGEIVIEDHFLSSNNSIETLNFLSGYTFDLTATNLIVAEELNYGNLAFTNPNGTSAADLIFVGLGQEYYTQSIANGGGAVNSTSAKEGDDIIFANYALYVWGGDGNDTVYGYARDISLGAGDDQFFGSDRNDFPYHGMSVTGGEGNDILHGTNMDDRFRGDETNGDGNSITNFGDDILYGYGGDDHLHGNEGNDQLYGGDGNDDIFGGDGNDVIYGDDGDDIINAGNGIDVVYGGDGDDQLIAGLTNSVLNSGNKTIYGGAGNDLLRDGADDDVLHGDSGNDRILATNGGNDYAYGDGGDDSVTVYATEFATMRAFGGSGDDHLWRYGENSTTGLIAGEAYFSDSYGNENYIFYHTNGGGSFYDLGTNFIFDGAGSQDSLFLVSGILSDMNFAVSDDDMVITFDDANGSITITDHFASPHHIENLQFGSIHGLTFVKTISEEHSFIEKLTTGVDT